MPIRAMAAAAIAIKDNSRREGLISAETAIDIIAGVKNKLGFQSKAESGF
jgi:hypothetical protein